MQSEHRQPVENIDPRGDNYAPHHRVPEVLEFAQPESFFEPGDDRHRRIFQRVVFQRLDLLKTEKEQVEISRVYDQRQRPVSSCLPRGKDPERFHEPAFPRRTLW